MNIKTPLKKSLLFTGLIVAVLVIILFLLPKASSQSLNPQLRLHRGTFDAQSSGPPAASQTPSQPAPGPYSIIQFDGPVTLADRAMLEQLGLTILEYIPDFAYLVQGADSQIAAAEALPMIYAQVPFTLADKLSPSLLRAVQLGQKEVGRQQIISWPGREEEMDRDLAALPFDAGGELTMNQLVQVANLAPVRWIEPLGRPRIINDVARSIMGVNSAWQEATLFGNGQIVGIADSGLDTGSQGTLSSDFAGRVLATYALKPGGDWADQHGHGTHVAGSVAGSGMLSGANPAGHSYATSFAGVAPEANLVIQGFEVLPDGMIEGLPDDYYELFNQVYTDGVRLHSNSWGDTTELEGDPPEYGGYNYGAKQTDQFVWDHPDMTIFVGAGNSGKDGVPGALGFCLGDGVIDPDSLLSPGTAKNVVTVGASEGTRDEGPLAGYIWLLASFCFATQPISADPIADNPNGMAAFSSRGPADDGRVKPDIIAPGTNIVSSRSHDPAAGILWAEYDPDYLYSGGTSMATPLVAGMGALAREWLTLQGAANPSAALVKAMLLNTTHDMAPGQYGTGATQEIPYNRPNNVAGWGRAALGFTDPPPYYGLWFDDHDPGLTTGQTITYTHTISQPLEVLTDTLPLRIMLTWTDPPASLSATANLVNDLDVVVSGPGGTYYGNDESTGDRTNNVEGIIINNPPVGQYQVTITAYNVPVASQPYALVIGGPLKPLEPPVISHNPVTSAEAVRSLPITATVTSEGPPLAVTLYYSSTGDSAYGSLLMGNSSGDVYSATIPAEDVMSPSLSYYIEATDTISTVVAGPFPVSVVEVPLPPPAPTAPTGVISDTTPTYVWGETTTATDYHIYLTDADGQFIYSEWVTVVAACSAGSCSHTPPTILDEADYNWYVQASNSSVTGLWSAGTPFTVFTGATAPGPVTPLAPNGDISDTTPTFFWTAVTNAIRYHLYLLDGDRLFAHGTTVQALNACSAGTCTYTMPTALPDGDYRWFIRAENPLGGAWSAPMLFTLFTGSATPVPATLLAPNGNISDTSPTYQWNEVPEAINYKVYVLDEDRFFAYGTIVQAQNACVAGACSHTAPTALPDGDYRWFIQAINPLGSAWSAPMLFTLFTGSAAPGQATPVAPNGTISDSTPTYDWLAASEAIRYQVYLMDDNNQFVYGVFVQARNACSGINCSLTPAIFLPNNDYTWFIQAINPLGTVWSAPMTFTKGP